MSKEIEKLIQGYHQFRETYFADAASGYKDLVRNGQSPKVLMVACSDSRVDPALIMNCEPGDLFVIRNVANLVPPYEADRSFHGTSAALEFGVCGLEVQHIILFGHTQCGGIQALLEKPFEKDEPKGLLSKWMELAKPAHEAVLKHHTQISMDEKSALCGRYSLINSLNNLQTFPWIKERVQKGDLSLHAWNFDLERGCLEVYDPDKNCFESVV